MDATHLDIGTSYKVTGDSKIRGYVQGKKDADNLVTISSEKAVLTYLGHAPEGYFRFSVSGVKVPGGRIDVRPATVIDMTMVITQPGDIFKGREMDLPLLPEDHPVRKYYEAEMERAVEEDVARARSGGNGFYEHQAVTLLLRATQAKPNEWDGSFALWLARRGKVLGVETCYQIGMNVCRRLNFTPDEARRILKDTPWKKKDNYLESRS